jgi:hypothetical protein
MSHASEPSAPRLFGREMEDISGERRWWRLECDEWTALIHQYENGEVWFSLTGESVEAVSVEQAVEAIEVQARSFVLSLAPLLDDAAKRELVKAAGIGLGHFPECKDEAESEVTRECSACAGAGRFGHGDGSKWGGPVVAYETCPKCGGTGRVPNVESEAEATEDEVERAAKAIAVACDQATPWDELSEDVKARWRRAAVAAMRNK